MSNSKAIPGLAGFGLAVLVLVTALTASAQRPAPSQPLKRACSWRFSQVPHGYVACRIDRVLPEGGVSLVSRFACNDGRMINQGQSAPNRGICPNGWER